MVHDKARKGRFNVSLNNPFAIRVIVSALLKATSRMSSISSFISTTTYGFVCGCTETCPVRVHTCTCNKDRYREQWMAFSKGMLLDGSMRVSTINLAGVKLDLGEVLWSETENRIICPLASNKLCKLEIQCPVSVCIVHMGPPSMITITQSNVWLHWFELNPRVQRVLVAGCCEGKCWFN